MITKKEALIILKKREENKYLKVKELLEKASEYYYNSDKIILSDKDYDDIYKLYNSITEITIVGAKPASQKGTINVSHQYTNLVGTLGKAQNLDECFEDFVDLIVSKFDTFDLQSNSYIFNLSLKFDGNSVTFEFDKNGNLKKALTRGRNGQGKDLTNVFKDFKSANKISMNEEFAIKNEIVIEYKNFDLVSELNGEDYSNPRSLVSGILGSDNAYNFRKYLTIVPLTMKTMNDNNCIPKKELPILNATNECYTFKNEIEKVFGKNYYNKYSKKETASNGEEFKSKIKDYYNYVNSIRGKLDFMIDGIVIDILNKEIREEMGYNPSGEIPKFSIALKLPYLEAETNVESCEFCVGSHGRVTPLIHFKPVNFNGTEHTKQQVSSVKRLNDLSIGIGSKVLITYNNDCLSYISKIEDPSNNKIKPFEYPKNCPSCGKPLKFIKNRKTDEITLAECINNECTSIKLGKVINFLSVMDYKGIKENIITKLFENNLMNDITDFYNLDYKAIEKIDGLGKGTCKIICDEIKRKEYYDYEILGSLSFKDVALESAKIICENYSLDDIIDYYNNDILQSKLLQVPSIGSIKAENFEKGFEENSDIIEFLMDRGYKERKKEMSMNIIGVGKKIVFTGFRDFDLQFKLEKMGHKVASSVSGKTDILVHDGNPGATKIKAAKEKGITIMELSEFIKEFNLN